MNRLKLMWLALRKPYLFGPAATINSAVINGRSEVTATITYKDGSTKLVKYTLVTQEPSNRY